MLMPKATKYRKQQRGKRGGKATRCNRIAFGEYGLKALECGWITNRQIEAARIAITRHVRRGGRIFIRIFPHKPITKHPTETRMGSGKGAPEGWVAVVKPGTILFELEGVSREVAEGAMRRAGNKLPISTKLVVREDLQAEE